jgi:hypothetical protein
MFNFNNDYYFDCENNNFEIINIDIDNIININNKMIEDYNIELYDNIIRVKCSFLLLILSVNYFYYYTNDDINKIDEVETNRIEDID